MIMRTWQIDCPEVGRDRRAAQIATSFVHKPEQLERSSKTGRRTAAVARATRLYRRAYPMTTKAEVHVGIDVSKDRLDLAVLEGKRIEQ